MGSLKVTLNLRAQINYYPSFPDFVQRNRVGDMPPHPKVHCYCTIGPYLYLGIRIPDQVQEILLNYIYNSFLRHSMFGKIPEILENFPQMLIRVLGVRNTVKKKPYAETFRPSASL
jgi:hypothetical protein